MKTQERKALNKKLSIVDLNSSINMLEDLISRCKQNDLIDDMRTLIIKQYLKLGKLNK